MVCCQIPCQTSFLSGDMYRIELRGITAYFLITTQYFIDDCSHHFATTLGCNNMTLVSIQFLSLFMLIILDKRSLYMSPD